MLMAEIGVDMSRWRSARAFCSWLGLCPGAKISGGKVLSRRTRRVVNRASVILRVAALAVGRTDSWLGRFYRRKKAHLGAPKAITATARKIGLRDLSHAEVPGRVPAAGFTTSGRKNEGSSACVVKRKLGLRIGST